MSSSDWRLQPLRSFWQGVNWENRVIAPTTSNNGKGIESLSLLMSVREYFRAISWAGVPEIAAAKPESKPSINSIDASNATLEDFLDDISQFF